MGDDLYRHPEYRRLYAACLADFAEGTGWAALRDWLREHGVPEEVVQETEPLRRLTPYDIVSFLIGSGSGIGSGLGSGSGSGSGRGSGSGLGSGSGSGRGRGIGSGSGIGLGSGIGIGLGSGIGRGRGIGRGSAYHEVFQMEPGKAYLVHCGDWHTFVGRCVRQVGPMTYLFAGVSKIHETNNGDNWESLAAGDAKARAAATYRHYATPATVPLTVIAFEWAGATPQETRPPAGV